MSRPGTSLHVLKVRVVEGRGADVDLHVVAAADLDHRGVRRMPDPDRTGVVAVLERNPTTAPAVPFSRIDGKKRPVFRAAGPAVHGRRVTEAPRTPPADLPARGNAVLVLVICAALVV